MKMSVWAKAKRKQDRACEGQLPFVGSQGRSEALSQLQRFTRLCHEYKYPLNWSVLSVIRGLNHGYV